jgi:hypothetical protein
MTRYIVDFEVKSDLLLLADGSKLKWHHPEGSFEVHLSNAKLGDGELEQFLSVQVIVQADEIRAAEELATDRLLIFLDAMSFVTNTRFHRRRTIRVIDWSPGLAMREFLQFTRAPSHQLFGLDESLLDTVSLVLPKIEHGPLRRAFRWFRHGTRESIPEEQFQYFWFAIELVAQVGKTAARVADECPHCHGPLYCNACDKTPTHRQYPKQAIRELVRKVIRDEPDAAIEYLEEVRNTLLHGDEVDEIVKKTGKPLTEAVDLAGRVAWASILNSMPLQGSGTVKFLTVNTHINREMTMTLLGKIGSPANADCPDIEAISMPEMSFQLGPIASAAEAEPRPATELGP